MESEIHHEEAKGHLDLEEHSSENDGEEHGEHDEDEERVLPSSYSVQAYNSHKWVKKSSFIGLPVTNNFRVTKERMRPLREGEILVQAWCWTVDPYVRVFNIPLDHVVWGEQVGSVIESHHEDFPIYSLVICSAGWRTYAILNPDRCHVTKVPLLGQLPVSLCLGILGYPGIMAYVAVQLKCQIKQGDVVLLNSAVGPVASVIGQLAKGKGATVIAFCSNNEHAVWLRTIGFDYVYNDVFIKPSSALGWVAPDGVDYYFDSVGENFTHSILAYLRQSTTVCLFGYSYSNLAPTGKDPYHMIWVKSGSFCTDSVFNYQDQFDTIQARLISLIGEGKLKYRENIMRDFDNLPTFLINTLKRPVVGRVVVASSMSTLRTVVVEF